MLLRRRGFFPILFLGFALLVPPASVGAQFAVTLSSSAAPSAGQAGLTNINLTGSNFPSGIILPANITVTLTPATAGPPSATTQATAVTAILGTVRRVTFQIPASIVVASPTAYQVSLSGVDSNGTTFSSGNTAALTVNPPARVVSLTPNLGQARQTLSVAIAGQYTNFVQGATQASFGPGISVGGAAVGAFGPVTVTSPTTATAQLVINASAPSLETVSVQTGGQQASLAGGFLVNHPPVANPGGPYAANVAQSISFDGSKSSDPDNDSLTFSWSFGDNSTGSGPTPVHAYANFGNFTVSLTVNDGRGGVNTATTTASINGLPIANPGGPYRGSVGQSVQFDGSRSGDPDGDLALTYAWNFGDQSTGTGAKPAHTYNAAGTFTVTLTVDDGRGGTGSASTTATISQIGQPPVVTITSPGALSLLNVSPITVTGTVDNSSDTIVVNGIKAVVSNGIFTAQSVPLKEGPNVLTATATDANGNVGTASISVTLDTTPPRVTIDNPANGSVVTTPTITVSGMISDVVLGTVNVQQATVSVNGIVAQVSNRNYLVNTVPLSPGSNTITAIGKDAAGNTASVSITVVFTPQMNKPMISMVSGNNQSGTIGTQLPSPLVVGLTDASGKPVAGQMVVFRIAANNGTLFAPAAIVAPDGRSAVVQSDANGQAQATWTLGMRAGAGNNVVTATAANFVGTVNFTSIALPGTPGMISLDAGNNQTGVVGQALPRPFMVVVTDAGHNRLPNIPVTFTVIHGGGSINGPATMKTDSDGHASAILILGLQEGIHNNLVEANFAGNTGFPATFTASAMAAGDPAKTQISGVVLDNSNIPIAGVSLSVEGTSLTTQSDLQGQFVLTGVPVGTVKLKADGSTATRPGSWPTLVYELVTVAGQNNTIGMPIYLLPLNLPEGLQVDATHGGTMTLAGVPGFSLTIAPGSVTFPDGSNSGVVSVTLVHADKVPMTPNFGQQPRFIVSIQPAGAKFNPPAPMTIPNVDGLKPGEVTEMYSFDHDLGSFVAIGTGTVSGDGTVIKSDPGVGIIKGGWHCGGNPSTSGTAHNCPQCQKCVVDICQPDTAQNGNACDFPTGSGNAPGVCKDGNCACPVPVNFRQTAASDAGGGTLHFEYAWDSSTGNLADLSNCQIGEKVDYPGADPFVWPNPPWNGSNPNPTIIDVAATPGTFQDNHSTVPFVKPYQNAAFSATQNYRYTCACANNGNPVVVDGPLSIDRSVTRNPDGSFKFTVTKSGSSATINPLP